MRFRDLGLSSSSVICIRGISIEGDVHSGVLAAGAGIGVTRLNNSLSPWVTPPAGFVEFFHIGDHQVAEQAVLPTHRLPLLQVPRGIHIGIQLNEVSRRRNSTLRGILIHILRLLRSRHRQGRLTRSRLIGRKVHRRRCRRRGRPSRSRRTAITDIITAPAACRQRSHSPQGPRRTQRHHQHCPQTTFFNTTGTADTADVRTETGPDRDSHHHHHYQQRRFRENRR